MSVDTLNSAAVDFLENNRKLCNSLVDSYRRGGHMLAQRIESGWKTIVEVGPTNAKIRGRLLENGRSVTKFLANRVTTTSSMADSAFNKACDGAATVIDKLQSRVEAVDNVYLDKYFEYLGAATLPAAKLAVDLSGRIADGAQRISGKAIAVKKKAAKRRTAKSARTAKKTAHAK